MNIDRVQRQLEIDEGVEFEIYEDHLGYPTFGVGHLVLKTDEEYGQPIGSLVDSDRVNSAFKHDLAVAVDECAILYSMWNTYPEEVQEVLVNMLFNLDDLDFLSLRILKQHWTPDVGILPQLKGETLFGIVR